MLYTARAFAIQYAEGEDGVLRFYDVIVLDEEHLTRHGVSVREVVEALRNDPDVFVNRRGRAANYIAFGNTDAGRKIVVPLNYDRGELTARPIAAWEDDR